MWFFGKKKESPDENLQEITSTPEDLSELFANAKPKEEEKTQVLEEAINTLEDGLIIAEGNEIKIINEKAKIFYQKQEFLI